MGTKKNKNLSFIDRILKNVVIPKKHSGKGNATKILFKMRYGSDWKKYYPLSK